MTTPPTALTKATERSISPIRSTNTTPIAIVAIAAICSRRFVKLRSVRNVSSRMPNDDDDDAEPDDDRQRAQLAGPDALPPEAHVAGQARLATRPRGVGGAGSHRGRRWVRPSVGVDLVSLGHPASSIPGTWSSVPAVIACTTSCWVVSARSSMRHALAEAEHRDPVGDLEDVVQVVRDDHDAEVLARPGGGRGRAPGGSGPRRGRPWARRG